MIKKEVFIGFVTGILSNLVGMLLYTLLFSDMGLWESLKESIRGEFLGTLIAAGAILNFLPFFFFLNRNKTYRARGVLLASIMAALGVAVLKLF